MNKWLLKILVLLVGVSFTLAVFEIDLGYDHNTFHDEDDTYVQSNNQNIELSAHFEKQKDILELKDFAATLFSLFFPDTQTDSDPPPQKAVAYTSQKIFLRNSVWRI